MIIFMKLRKQIIARSILKIKVMFATCMIGFVSLNSAEADAKEPALRTILSSTGSESVKELYPLLNGGKFEGPLINESPDPLIRYRWHEPKESDGLQIYFLKPVSLDAAASDSFLGLSSGTTDTTAITIKKPGSIRLDFGVVSGAWVEFDSPDCLGGVEMSISEFNEPGVGKYL
jgi:hypothetical protein